MLLILCSMLHAGRAQSSGSGAMRQGIGKAQTDFEKRVAKEAAQQVRCDPKFRSQLSQIKRLRSPTEFAVCVSLLQQRNLSSQIKLLGSHPLLSLCFSPFVQL